MKVVNVPSFEHRDIAGEPVDNLNSPQPQCFDGGTSPLVIEHEPGVDHAEISQLSAVHGRSYLVKVATSSQAVWVDQYGNPHTALTTKGNNLTQPGFVRSPTAPSGFLPYGLQEGDALLRVVRASRIMREANIDTERPLKIVEPELLIFKGKEVDINEYKSLLVEEMLATVSSNATQVERYNPFTYKEVSDAAVVLKSLSFFVTLRSTSVAARVGDLTRDGRRVLGLPFGHKINYDELSKVFKAYNDISPQRASDLRAMGLALEMPTDVNDASDDAVEHYFAEILPKLAALNLSRLHNAGLVHQFLHANNFTALGGIVDLDSVKGDPLELGDKIDQTDSMVYDNSLAAESIFQMVNWLQGHGLNWFKLSDQARQNYVSTYLQLLDSPLSKRERATHIFSTAGKALFYVPGLSKSMLDVESLKEFYPDVEKVLSAAKVEGEEYIRKNGGIEVSAKQLAEILIQYGGGNIRSSIWSHLSAETNDEDGNVLYNQGEPPSDDALMDALPDAIKADMPQGRLFAEELYEVCIRPNLRAALAKELTPAMEAAADKFFKILLPGESFSRQELNNNFAPLLDDLQSHLVTCITMPGYDDFWHELRKQYKEQYLDEFDRSIIPSSVNLSIDPSYLKKFAAFWEYDSRYFELLTRGYANLPADAIAAMLDSTINTEYVTHSDEVLQIEHREKELTRLLITDGDINSSIHYGEVIIEGMEEATFLQYCKENGTPHGATIAVYVLQSNDDFRILCKKLRTS